MSRNIPLHSCIPATSLFDHSIVCNRRTGQNLCSPCSPSAAVVKSITELPWPPKSYHLRLAQVAYQPPPAVPQNHPKSTFNSRIHLTWKIDQISKRCFLQIHFLNLWIPLVEPATGRSTPGNKRMKQRYHYIDIWLLP